MSEYVCEIPDVVKHDAQGGNKKPVGATQVGLVRERIIRCKDCKFFRDHEWVIITDVPNVCKKWSGGSCATSPDGFCFLAEPKEEKDER